MEALLPAVADGETDAAPDVQVVYRDHGDFIWRCLLRSGVREADAEDALQEVLVAAHRHLRNFDPARAALRSWLFGIVLRVASAYRRRACRRNEVLGEPPIDTSDASTPETELERARSCERLERVLDTLSPVKRATFVMFELEGLSCEEIANASGVPIGTVHSRLFSARRDFARALKREHATRRGARV